MSTEDSVSVPGLVEGCMYTPPPAGKHFLHGQNTNGPAYLMKKSNRKQYHGNKKYYSGGNRKFSNKEKKK